MKRSKKWFNSVAMLAMLIGFNATSNAEINVVIAGDTTGEGDGSGEVATHRASLLANTATDYVINIIPSAGVPMFASSFPLYAGTSLTRLYNTGILPIGIWSGVEDPRMLAYFTPDDIMASPVPFWERNFSPIAPNQFERGRTIVVWVTVSKPGGKVSLDQVIVHLRSLEGTLNKDTTFTGRAYSQYAWGVDKGTQTIIKSGNADNAYPMIMVGVLMNYYEVKTPADVDEVLTYIEHWKKTEGYDLYFSVQVGGSTASKWLYLAPPPVVEVDSNVRLKVTAQGNGQVTVVLVGLPAMSTHRFKIQTKANMGGVFQDYQDIGSGDMVFLPRGASQLFVRLKP